MEVQAYHITKQPRTIECVNVLLGRTIETVTRNIRAVKRTIEVAAVLSSYVAKLMTGMWQG